MNKVYDAHIHNKNHECGGFLIGLEGEPLFEGTLSNEEAMKLHSPQDGYYSFYYVKAKEINDQIEHPLLKYHPRREKYSFKLVDDSIALNNPIAVVVDTLNEPYWRAYDYWELARRHPKTEFIMAHSGGYLICDFVKICHFQSNVWIDFGFTHTILGALGDNTKGLQLINQTITYALNSSFRNRVLLASDYPFCNQDEVFEYYSKAIKMLNENFLRLTSIIDVKTHS